MRSRPARFPARAARALVRFRPGLRTLATLGVVAACSALAPAAESRPRAFIGARILPIQGAAIEHGTLVVQDGKILAVGPEDRVAVPEGAESFDARGRVIMPGLIDTHSHIGQVQGGDKSAAMHPDVRALDSIDVRHNSVHRARAGGLTTVNVMPGSGLIMSGQTLYLKLRRGDTLDALALRNPDGSYAGGMKMANGTNPRGEPPLPGSRAKAAAIVRGMFVKAQEYRRRRMTAPPAEAPDRDLGMEALLEVLDGKRMVHHHTHRHDDILTVLRLKQEFGFRVTLHHVSDAWLVADEIAKAAVPCSIILVDSPGGKEEALNLSWRSGAALEKAGVVVAFHTDDPITDSRLFLRSAGLAVRAGMSREGALFGLTMAGAIILDLDRRIGSLETGKDADFVVLDGDPLSVYTHVLETWVEGERVFDRANPEDLKFAQGGDGAGDREPLDDCCLGRDGSGELDAPDGLHGGER